MGANTTIDVHILQFGKALGKQYKADDMGTEAVWLVQKYCTLTILLATDDKGEHDVKTVMLDSNVSTYFN